MLAYTMSQLNKRLNDSQPDQVYFDLTVSNFQSTTQEPAVFAFNDSRTTAYINKPDDYFLSILRFTIDTGTVPVFIPSIQTNQGDLNLTIYSVTMTYEDVGTGITFTSQQFVNWLPQDENAPVPSPPSGTYNGQQDNSQGYYNCYSYSWFVYLVWQAFVAAFDDLNVQLVAAGAGLLPAQYAPLLNWDTTNNQAVLYTQQGFYESGDPTSIQLYMNASCFSLFSSFPARLQGYAGVLNGENVRLIVADIGGLNTTIVTVPGGGGATWIATIMYQECPVTSSWSPITAIVFTSNTLPINANQVSTPLVYSDNQLITLGGNNSATQNIITDIVSDAGLYRPNLVYIPQAEYRLIDLYGNSPLHNLDINIFYRLKSGELVPFRLQSGGAVTMKIAFLRKNSRYGKREL